MPIYIDRVTSNVTVVEGELPFTREQLDKLVELVLRRLDEKHREEKQSREARALRSGAAPPTQFEE